MENSIDLQSFEEGSPKMGSLSRNSCGKGGLSMATGDVRRSLEKSPSVGRSALSEVTNGGNAGNAAWKVVTPEKRSRIKQEMAIGSPLGMKLKSILTPSKKRAIQLTVIDSKIPGSSQPSFFDIFNNDQETPPVSSPVPQYDISKRLSKVSALCHKVSTDKTKLEAASAFQRSYIRFLEKERLQLQGQLAEASALAQTAERVHEEKSRLEGELQVQLDRRLRAEQREAELMEVVQSWGREFLPQPSGGSIRSTPSAPGSATPRSDRDQNYEDKDDADKGKCDGSASKARRATRGGPGPRHQVSCVWHGPAHAILRQAGEALTELRDQLACARGELEQSRRCHARLVAVAKAERVTSLVAQLGSGCSEDRTRAVVTLADVTAASRSLSWDDLVLGAGTSTCTDRSTVCPDRTLDPSAATPKHNNHSGPAFGPGATPGSSQGHPSTPMSNNRGLSPAPDALVALLMQRAEGEGGDGSGVVTGADGSSQVGANESSSGGQVGANLGESAGATDERHKLAILQAGGATALVALLRNANPTMNGKARGQEDEQRGQGAAGAGQGAQRGSNIAPPSSMSSSSFSSASSLASPPLSSSSSLAHDGGLPLFQRSMAARVLANLCSKSGRCKAVIAGAGAIPLLMSLLGEGVAALALASSGSRTSANGGVSGSIQVPNTAGGARASHPQPVMGGGGGASPARVTAGTGTVTGTVTGASPKEAERQRFRTMPGCASPATPRVAERSPQEGGQGGANAAGAASGPVGGANAAWAGAHVGGAHGHAVDAPMHTPGGSSRPPAADASCHTSGRGEASGSRGERSAGGHKRGGNAGVGGGVGASSGRVTGAVTGASGGRGEEQGEGRGLGACACAACAGSNRSDSTPLSSATIVAAANPGPCLHWADAVTNASAALWSLSLAEGNRARIAGSQRCVEDLVLLVGRGPAECRPSAAAVLWNLALDARHRPRLARAGCVPALVGLLVSGTPDGQAKAAGALGNLALDEGTRSAIRHAGGIPALISVLRLSHGGRSTEASGGGGGSSSSNKNSNNSSSSSSSFSSVLAAKVKAARALSCLAYHNEENRAAILGAGAAPHLLELCQVAGYPEARSTAERALASLQWEVID